jgi:uncharacterized membrane protein
MMQGWEKNRRRKPMIRLTKTEYLNGDSVPVSAIYECSDCWSITAFKQGERFFPCEECEHPDDDQHWVRTTQFLHFVTKNLNSEFENIETFSLHVADIIAEWAGNIWFVILHVIWFGIWTWTNTGHEMFGLVNFDPYPFGLLTMIVSLEAIFLSTFILISQNRQGQKSELRAELDYQVNLKTEKDVSEVLSILRDIRKETQAIEEDTAEILESREVEERSGASKKSKKRSKSHARKKREQKAAEIIEDAGIDVIEHNE